MVRKLPVLITMGLLALTPLASHALGFGNIKLNSALNEPFNAEIDLLSATVDETSGLTIKLASREAFLRAGIDRPVFLGDMKFEIKSRADDTFYIKLTTRQPVREPFLNFLLELNWYNGRILREYTVLLDPPGRIVKQPTVVGTPEVKPSEQIVREEALAEVQAEEPMVEPEAVAEVPVVEEPAAEPEMAVAPEATMETELVLEPVPEPEAAMEPEMVAEPEVAEEAAPKPIKSGLAAILDRDVPADSAEEVMPEAGEPLVEPETLEAPAPIPGNEYIAAFPEGATVEEGMEASVENAFVDDGELFPRIPLTNYSGAVTFSGEEGEMAVEQGAYDYGISKKGDNLWTVARKLQRDESISIYQIMMALLKSNPDAFVNGNIHRLKVGHVLRIDDPGLLAAMSDSEARAAYQMQTGEWDSYRQEIAAVTDADMTESQPIVAGDMEIAEQVEPTEATGELTVAAPGGEEATAGEGLAEGTTAVNQEMAALQEELRQLRSDAAAMGGSDAALNQHIAELETELAVMQRAISIEDSSLAAMQQQLAEKAEQAQPIPSIEPDASAETAEPIAETAPEEVMAESTMEPVAEEQAPVETPAPEIVANTEPVEGTAMETPAEPADEGGMQDGDMANQVALKPAPAPAPVPAPMTTQEKATGVMAMLAGVGGVLTGLVGDPLLAFVGLPALLVLIILMAIVIRRRKKAQGNFQESILSGEPASVTAAEASDGESSFLSDFAVSGAGAIQAEDSEVDPLTEADVFMAYGRYEAAEERLNEAMEHDPNRKEYKLKLLEVYNATQNVPAFESMAEDFYASLGENASSDPMWEKVVSMGKELAPNNPLFTGAVVAPAVATEIAHDDPGVNLSDSQVMDIGLETGVFNTDDFSPQLDASTEEATDLDFNLDLGNEEESPAVTAEVNAIQDEGSLADLDFDLDFGEMGSEKIEPETGEISESPTSEMEMPDTGMDFNVDFSDDSAKAYDIEAGLEMNLPDTESEIAESAETSETLETDLAGLDFDMGEDTTASDETAGGLEFDIGEDTFASDETAGGLELDMDKDEGSSDATMMMDLDLGTGLDLDTGTAEDDTALDLNMTAAADLSLADSDMDSGDATMAIDLGTMGNDLGLQDETATDIAMDMPEMSDVGESADIADLDLSAAGDEVGTKLDLARAYIDMGDPEGARSILDEVLDEGDDSQKQEAQQLMQQIA